MKTVTLNLFILLLVSTLISGCSGGGDSTPIDNTHDVEDIYYGKWIFAENGDELNIDTTTVIDYVASNNNLLIVTDSDGTKKSYLRASPSKVSLTGKLEKHSAATLSYANKSGTRASSYASVGNIDVILQNITDGNIKATITTDENGYFSDSSLSAGEYTIKAQDDNIKIDTTITLSDKDEDLGTFILLDENQHNFKAELILNGDFILANEQLNNITLRVNNISQTEAYGIWFDVKIIDENGNEYDKTNIQYSDSTTTDDSIGTIMSKSYKDIAISFSFNRMYQNNKDVTIQITIHDADNNTWNEELKFVLYKDTLNINVDTSAANLKGYIRLPYNDQILAIDMAKGSITLPLLNEDKHYPLVLANSGALGGETKYSIGLNKPTIDFSDFKNTGAYEDDDMEEEANNLSIGDEAIVSYIHYGDLDYWKIITPQTDELINYEPTANAGADQTTKEGDTISLNALNSNDRDGTIVSYEWKEGDTILSKEISFSKSDLSIGTHTITLIVTDNDGEIDIDTIEITITDPSIITHHDLTYKAITSPHTGKVWLDRNVGASRACLTRTDMQCYGDYLQWGRGIDGHEKSDSATTTVQATDINNPGDEFIMVVEPSYNHDWAYNLDAGGDFRAMNWLKIDGSSICPVGFRAPLIDELSAETTDLGADNYIDVFNSFLKLPSEGNRIGDDGTLLPGWITTLWTASIEKDLSWAILLNDNNASWGTVGRSMGYSVRCIKD